MAPPISQTSSTTIVLHKSSTPPDVSIGGNMSSILVVDSEQIMIKLSKMIKVSQNGQNDEV